jgi:hypothetical protein
MERDTEYLTCKEAAELLRCTVAALARSRHERRGPPYLRPARRIVRYRRSDLVAWLEGGRVQHDCGAGRILEANSHAQTV